jgi:hypothetical protein
VRRPPLVVAASGIAACAVILDIEDRPPRQRRDR